MAGRSRPAVPDAVEVDDPVPQRGEHLGVIGAVGGLGEEGRRDAQVPERRVGVEVQRVSPDVVVLEIWSLGCGVPTTGS